MCFRIPRNALYTIDSGSIRTILQTPPRVVPNRALAAQHLALTSPALIGEPLQLRVVAQVFETSSQIFLAAGLKRASPHGRSQNVERTSRCPSLCHSKRRSRD